MITYEFQQDVLLFPLNYFVLVRKRAIRKPIILQCPELCFMSLINIYIIIKLTNFAISAYQERVCKKGGIQNEAHFFGLILV